MTAGICDATAKTRGSYRFACTLDVGHDGPHVAEGGRTHICAVWHDEGPVYTTEVDPRLRPSPRK